MLIASRAHPTFEQSLSRIAASLVSTPDTASAPRRAQTRPERPEPMVFDMVRGLGARQGELEVNTLAQLALADGERVAWAPEIEYALIDGFAAELELPFEGGRLAELKFGLQGTFGTSRDGRVIHGVQYLGIHDRHDGGYASTLVYIVGQRLGARLSSITMVGLDDIRLAGRAGHNGLIVNHSVFAELSDSNIAGLEVNFKGGREGGVLLMPQLHHALAPGFNLQGGVGIERNRGERAKPRVGLRLIREL